MDSFFNLLLHRKISKLAQETIWWDIIDLKPSGRPVYKGPYHVTMEEITLDSNSEKYNCKLTTTTPGLEKNVYSYEFSLEKPGEYDVVKVVDHSCIYVS